MWGMAGKADPLAVAEKVLAILDEGSFSATYKYAVLMALLDLCFEHTSTKGVPPDALTTRQVAEKVLELYWPQCVPYADERGVLRQGGVNHRQQAELVKRIVEFRHEHAAQPLHSASRAQLAQPDRYKRLLDFVEWKLIEMPLPRLQVIGRTEDRFLYQYGWTRDVSQSTVKANDFDNRLLLMPGIAEALIRLNTLLRPLIRREWLRLVQLFNRARIPVSELETFLFDREREALGALHDPLRELQAGRCFYCDERAGGGDQVDHFIPWARYPNNAIENLVVAHAACNNSKRDFLATAQHVGKWTARLAQRAGELRDIAADTAWETATDRSRRVAVAIYAQLPDAALLWGNRDHFVAYGDERGRIEQALRAAA